MNGLYQIAIDGPAASGKSTVAKLVAKQLGAFYVNTGEMYRTVAWASLQLGIDVANDQKTVVEALKGWTLEPIPPVPGSNGELEWSFNGSKVDRTAIRTSEVAMASSQVAKIPEVREWMLNKQRDCRSLGTIIMEGRDICTVILPDATAKFFITASPEERARRRFNQSGEIATGASIKSVAEEIAKRDEQDATRKVAPLRPAEDATVIMTDGMSVDEVAAKVIEIFNRRKSAL